MKWFLKLIGYKYKIICIKTIWRASEFQKTGMVKVPLEMPFTPVDLERRLKSSWMWLWDTDSVKTLYTKSSRGLNKLITLDGTKDYYNSSAIEQHFDELK